MAETLVYRIRVEAAGVTPAVDLDGTPAGEMAVQALDGTVAFTGTCILEGSVDGATWGTLATCTDGMVVTQIAGLFKFIRGNATAYTSGALVIHVATHRP